MMKRVRAVLMLSFLSFISLLSIPLLCPSVDQSVPQDFAPCDDQGPTFDLIRMGEQHHDLGSSSEPAFFRLRLTVGVFDDDNVSTVIGSYKDSSENNWHNLTLSLDESSAYGANTYTGIALDCYIEDVGVTHRWNIKFYANDTLDNWSTSDMTFVEVYRPSPYVPPSDNNSLLFILFIVIMMVVLFFVIAYPLHIANN